VGGILFSLFAAFYYWYPKMSGRMLNTKLAHWHFWLFLVGFHVTFDPMHFVGLDGMVRPTFTYPVDRGRVPLHIIISLGALIQAIATLMFVYNLVHSYFKGALAGPDPWDAWTLEWSVPSPPPTYTFAAAPTVESRRPLWDLTHPEDRDTLYE